MLLEMKYEVGVQVVFPGLPLSVIGIEPVLLIYNADHSKITYVQFPATLAYAITDYECQGQTFTWVIVDFKKPNLGPAAAEETCSLTARIHN